MDHRSHQKLKSMGILGFDLDSGSALTRRLWGSLWCSREDRLAVEDRGVEPRLFGPRYLLT